MVSSSLVRRDCDELSRNQAKLPLGLLAHPLHGYRWQPPLLRSWSSPQMRLLLCQGSHLCVERQLCWLTGSPAAVLQAMRFFQKADDLADQLAANHKKNSKMSALMKAADSASQQPGLGRSVTQGAPWPAAWPPLPPPAAPRVAHARLTGLPGGLQPCAACTSASVPTGCALWQDVMLQGGICCRLPLWRMQLPALAELL